MVLGEYIVTCPNCSTEVRLVAEMVTPIMFYCHGCDRSLVLIHDSIFTLPFEFVKELAEKHGVRLCGNVLNTRISKVAKQLINKGKISELHNLLDQKLDVQDFIKKIS